MAVNLPDIIFEMGHGQLIGTGSGVVKNCWTTMDTTKYDGSVSYYWEIEVENQDEEWVVDHYVAVDHTFQLVDADDNLYAEFFVESIMDTGNPPVYTRQRTTFTPASGATEYFLKLKEEVFYRVSVGCCRLILQQSGATETEIPFELGVRQFFNVSPPGDVATNEPAWHYHTAEWGTITEIIFEAYGKADGTGGSAYLTDLTSSTIWATLTWGANEEAIKRTTMDLDGLVDGYDIYQYVDWTHIQLWGVRIRVTVSPITAVAIRQRVAAGYSSPYDHDRVLYRAVTGTQVFFEGSYDAQTITLVDIGTSDTGAGGGSDVSNSEITLDGINTIRSTALNLTDGNRYIFDASAGYRGGSAWILILVSAPGGWKDFMPMLQRLI